MKLITRNIIPIERSLKTISKIQFEDLYLPIEFNVLNLSRYFNKNINLIKTHQNFGKLYHELNKFTDKKSEYIQNKTEIEKLLFVKYSNTKLTLNTLVKINKDLTNGKGELRTTDLALKSHRYNQQILFPNHSIAIKRLKLIIKMINDKNEMDFPFIVFIYVLILNAHPFTDGNGRLARLIFNLLAVKSNCYYIPIYDFIHYSEGGYEIRLREAEIFNRWKPIIQYFITCVRTCEELYD